MGTLSAKNENSFLGLWQILVEGWRWILSGTVGALVVAVGYLAITPPEYEAVGLVQIGQLEKTPVESQGRVLERLSLPTFKHSVMQKIGWTDDARTGLYERSLKAQAAKSADLIQIKVRGLTREDAAASLAATVDYLAATHKTTVQPLIQSVERELAQVVSEIRETEKILHELGNSAKLQGKLPVGARFGESVLYVQLVASNIQHIRELRNKEAQYRERISLAGKAATSLFSEPSLSENPVRPNNVKVLLLATLWGLAFGVVMVMLQPRNRRFLVTKNSNTSHEAADEKE